MIENTPDCIIFALQKVWQEMNQEVEKKHIQLDTPVLFLIFNRSDVTEQVFGQIRKVKPKQLFIAADGPRNSHPDDIEKCETTRNLVLDMVNWDCEVKTLFRDKNLGCGLAVSQAITWFFEHVEMGIILEDDCFADLSFFTFCQKLLFHFIDDNEIMHISGGCFLPSRFFGKESYYYSIYPYVWGWATWKRAWQKFHYNIDNLYYTISKTHSGYRNMEYWQNIFNNINSNRIDTWAWRWNFILWENRGISVSSTVNLIKNIGFSGDSTHTKSINKYYEKIPFNQNHNSIIRHNRNRKVNKRADKKVFEIYNLRKTSFMQKVKSKIYGRF